MTLVAASTADNAIRQASYTPPPHVVMPEETQPPLSEVGRDVYQILAQAAEVYQTKLSVVANNLANAETTAFKRSRVILEDLAYRHEKTPGAEDTAGQCTPTGISVGTGVRVAGVQTDFTQGTFCQTGRELDVAVQGDGFFQVMDPAGDTLYTRAGDFSRNVNGQVVMGSANVGRLLQPPITVPEDTTDVVISAEGIVSIREPGSPNLSQIGQIELAKFVNPEGLLRLGENLYAETDASGAPMLGNPGQDGIGSLRQGALEASNVRVDEELSEWRRTADRLRTIRRLLQLE
jgi:flagellar basal-body rod protein FlgG